MHETAEHIVEAVQRGRLGRREAVGRLVALAAATFAAGASSPSVARPTPAPSDAATDSVPEPSFKSVGLNHIALRVSDVARSRDFYRRHLGLPPRRISNRVYFNDPDGIEVQLASEWGDYPAPRR